jgi:hypothetical protein
MAFVPRDPQHRDELSVFTRKVFVVAGVVLLQAILWKARGVVLLVFIAAALAAGIAPAVHRVRVVGRHLLHRHISRGAAVLIVYFPFVVLVLLLLVVIVPRDVAQGGDLAAGGVRRLHGRRGRARHRRRHHGHPAHGGAAGGVRRSLRAAAGAAAGPGASWDVVAAAGLVRGA